MEEQNLQPQPNIPQEPQPIIQSETPQKPSLPTWLIILITVLVISVIGVGSYAAYQYLIPEPEPAELPITNEQEKVNPSQLPDGETINETANWQTYRNEEYGFEVKYPESWIKEIQDAQNKFIFKNPSNSNINLIVAVQNNPNNLTVRDFLKQQQFDLSYIKSDYNIGNYKGVKIRPEGLCPGDTIKISKDSYIISVVACTEDKTIADLFLSTFKFIESISIGHSALLSELIADLRKGDMKSAITKFAASNKNDLLVDSDSEEQNQLADWIENAQLTIERDNYVVYTTRWVVDEGGESNSIEVEFILSKDDFGQWKIISW